ncbi:MAG TPA: hypothetical protein EYN26_00395 [Chromatiales bacterium]|nr:hypothetical protein [Chromatiaceae bacterium]HIN83139.1 hypothetical protein [Chromatiales bacterium]HIO53589.1 hypothetical protein [Chromatiales bacterium]
MFSLFKSQPVLDEASALWIFEVFAWSLRQFNADVFYQHSILVTPSNKHFPGREDSVQGMAELIFANVQRHAGMSHWSFKVTSQHNTMQLDPPKVVLNGALRGVDLPVTDDAHHIIIPYDRNLVSNPEALIASFAAGLSHYLCSVSNEPPPGGEENWLYLIEVVAVFLGFGVLFCNSALTHRVRSCGSCAPRANRASHLSQFDLTYALAMFCVLKNIPNKEVLGDLKSSLRGHFKKARKDIQKRGERLSELRGIL